MPACMNILKTLKKLVEQSPADQTEALLITEDSSLTRFTPASVHQHVAERDQTLILRVVMGKQVAAVTTNLLQPSSLRTTLEKAVSLSRLLPPNPDFQSLPPPRPIAEAKTFHENIRRLTPGTKVRAIQEVMGLAKEKGASVSGAFSHGVVEVAVLNSLEVEAYQQYSDLCLHLIAQNEHGSGYASFASRDPDRLWIESLFVSLPPLSSATRTTIVYEPAAAYTPEALTGELAKPNVLPFPQSIDPRWVSAAPGSLKENDRVGLHPSASRLHASEPIAGFAFAAENWKESSADPPRPSLAVTVTIACATSSSVASVHYQEPFPLTVNVPALGLAESERASPSASVNDPDTVSVCPSMPMASSAAVATAGARFDGWVTVSHASPMPSPSESFWSGFAVFGQLSLASATPSPSPSASTTSRQAVVAAE